MYVLLIVPFFLKKKLTLCVFLVSSPPFPVASGIQLLLPPLAVEQTQEMDDNANRLRLHDARRLFLDRFLQRYRRDDGRPGVLEGGRYCRSLRVRCFPHLRRVRQLTSSLDSYLIGFAAAPLFLAPLSEAYGRYPVYFASSIIYLAFFLCIGLAQNIVRPPFPPPFLSTSSLTSPLT
jgi:MFS family permease